MEGFAFEAGVLAFLIAHPGMVSQFSSRLREYPFKLQAHKDIMKMVSGAIKTHGRSPTLSEVVHTADIIGESGDWPQVVVGKVKEVAASVWATEPTGVTGESVREFLAVGEAQELADKLVALKKSPKELLSTIPVIRARLEDLRQDFEASRSTGMFLFGEKDFDRATASVNELYTTAPVATGYKLLDQILLGGLRPGEVSIIMAVINSGKTGVAINMAVNMWKAGKKVLFVANDATEAEMCERVFACASGLPICKDKLLSAYRQEIRLKIPVDLGFCLEVWPPKRRKVSEVKNLVERLLNERGFAPDVIIADSGDLFVAEAKGDAPWLEATDVFYEQVAVAREMNVAWLATTQANREAFKALRDGQVMGMEHVGAALGKLQPVGNVFAIMQTMAERLLHTFRLGVLKLRRDDGVGTYIRFVHDWKKQLIVPWPSQKEPWPMWNKDGTPVHPTRDSLREDEQKGRQEALDAAGDVIEIPLPTVGDQVPDKRKGGIPGFQPTPPNRPFFGTGNPNG